MFFTERWRKPPFPLPMDRGGGVVNPVTQGYVFEGVGESSAAGKQTKL